MRRSEKAQTYGRQAVPRPAMADRLYRTAESQRSTRNNQSKDGLAQGSSSASRPTKDVDSMCQTLRLAARDVSKAKEPSGASETTDNVDPVAEHRPEEGDEDGIRKLDGRVISRVEALSTETADRQAKPRITSCGRGNRTHAGLDHVARHVGRHDESPKKAERKPENLEDQVLWGSVIDDRFDHFGAAAEPVA
jgi:hypothetical protein